MYAVFSKITFKVWRANWVKSTSSGPTGHKLHCMGDKNIRVHYPTKCPKYVLSSFLCRSFFFVTLIWFMVIWLIYINVFQVTEGDLLNGKCVFVCVCVRGGGWEVYKTFTMECGSCEEVRDTPAVSTLPRLLLLCPSASQDPEDPSRAATATAQTPRLPISVYLCGKVKTQGMDVLYPNTRSSSKIMIHTCMWESAHEVLSIHAHSCINWNTSVTLTSRYTYQVHTRKHMG